MASGSVTDALVSHGGLSERADGIPPRPAGHQVAVYSVHFGAGIEMFRLFGGRKYQPGLTSIDDSGNNLDVKNRVLAIVAGYGFRLGH
jgi:hypothetical protein